MIHITKTRSNDNLPNTYVVAHAYGTPVVAVQNQQVYRAVMGQA